MNALDLFKKLPHLDVNGGIKVVEDWGYAPCLYHFNGEWHVSWIDYEEDNKLVHFYAKSPEDAIKIAFEWCAELKLVEEVVGVAESPLKTFPRVNEFETGASYRR